MKREDSIDEHIAKFQMMVSESKLDKSSPVIIDLFRETLSMPLQKRILTLESPPIKLEDWYDWATVYEARPSMEEDDEDNGTNEHEPGTRKSRTLKQTILPKGEGSQCYGYRFIKH